MEYKIIIEKDPSGWYVGQCLQYPEAISEGETMEELIDNMREAIELVINKNEEEVLKSYIHKNYIRETVQVPV